MDHKTTIASYAGSAGAVAFGLSLNEVGVVVGIVCAVLTYVTNAYFQWKRLKLAELRAAGEQRQGDDDADD